MEQVESKYNLRKPKPKIVQLSPPPTGQKTLNSLQAGLIDKIVKRATKME